MKKQLLPFLAGLVLSCTQLPTNAQEFKVHISKEFAVTNASGSTLFIYNIDGFIKVEGYSGDKVVMEIDERISAKDEETLEKGKKVFKMGFQQKNDSIIAYIAEPYDTRPHNHHWRDNDDEDRLDCNFSLSYTVKVPFGMNLHVSTVNNGSITVKDVAGILHASNVNGPITLTNAKGKTHANTVNGKVTINYLVNPSGQSSYRTINGDIEVSYPSNLSADLQFKSMNGQFFTDFANAEVLPGKVIKNQVNKGDGTVYKLNKDTSVRIGTGGETFKFETLNGNIYIKKQS